MRSTLVCVVLFVVAYAEESPRQPVQFPEAGLSINAPKEWARNKAKEKGTTRFYFCFEPKYGGNVSMTVNVRKHEKATPASWASNMKSALKKWFEELDDTIQIADSKVGGQTAKSVVASGSKKGRPYRIRARMVLFMGHEIEFIENSYDDAHDENERVLEQFWKGIVIATPKIVSTPEETKDPVRIKDRSGNLRCTVPAGWEIKTRPPKPATTITRLELKRRDNNGEVCAELYLMRYQRTSMKLFKKSPAKVVDYFIKNTKFYDSFYGAGSRNTIRPKFLEVPVLASLKTGTSYEIRSLTTEQTEDLERARVRRRNDPKTAIPNYDPTVVRGHVAMLTPDVYFVVGWFRSDVGDNEQLLHEYESFVRSVDVFVAKPRPVPLVVEEQVLQNTLTDKKLAQLREVEREYLSYGRKTRKLRVRFKLPPGFKQVNDTTNTIQACAQDANNNWVLILMWHANHLKAGESDTRVAERQSTINWWREFWLKKDPAAKVPEKAQRVTMGRLRGRGYKKLKGTVDGFPATLGALLYDKSNWRTYLAVQTSGEGDVVFAAEIKALLKSIRIDYKAD